MRTTGPNQPAFVLLDVHDLLTEHHIPYGLIGALAASFHGVPRSTTDADLAIWLKGTGKTPKDLTQCLLEAGYHAVFKQGDIEDPVTGSIIVEDRHHNRIDILLGIRGMDPEAVNRCVYTPLLDSSVRVVAAEDLIPMKIFAGGFQDLEDVRGILQVSAERLNLDLLRRLARRYGANVAAKLEELLQEPR